MIAGTNTAATRSARAWMGALLPWASCTRRMIWARAVSRPTRVAVKTMDPLAVDGACHHRVAGVFVHRNGFAGEHGFVHGRVAVGDLAVHGDAFARSDQQRIADRTRSMGISCSFPSRITVPRFWDEAP
jgi:hypothetical protein